MFFPQKTASYFAQNFYFCSEIRCSFPNYYRYDEIDTKILYGAALLQPSSACCSGAIYQGAGGLNPQR
jgi:hypothetical protein